MGNNQDRKDELYAMKVLKCLYPGSFGSVVKDDKPDLQDSFSSIGVEVTKGMVHGQGKVDGFLMKIERNKECKVKPIRIRELEETGFRPLTYKGKIYGFLAPVYSPTPLVHLDHVGVKIRKLQEENMKKFHSNRLFLYNWEQIGDYCHREMHEFIDNVNNLQKGYNYKFDVIYIHDRYDGGFYFWTCYLKMNYVKLMVIGKDPSIS